MNLLILPELFCLISNNLNDKEKIFLTSSSKIIYNYKLLLILDSEYNLKEINDRWRVKNIIIKQFALESKIKELIKDLIPESIMVNSKYVKFVSNNENIKLFLSENIIRKLISYGCSYLAMKIMLNNDESANNINKQFIESSRYGYSSIVKLLIDLGANIHAQDDQAIIFASRNGYLSVVKLLIDSGADIHAQDNDAIIWASCRGHLPVVKILIKSGADIRAQNSDAIIWASHHGHLLVVKLLIKSGANIYTQNDLAPALECAKINKRSDIIELLERTQKKLILLLPLISIC